VVNQARLGASLDRRECESVTCAFAHCQWAEGRSDGSFASHWWHVKGLDAGVDWSARLGKSMFQLA
jgi:hypothetical protein